MKNVKKIGIALSLMLVIVALVIMTALAAGEYTGNVAALNSLVEAVGQAETTKDRESAMTAVENYLVKTPVDPEEAGYEELMVAIKQLRIDMVGEYLEQLAATDPVPTLAAKMASVQSAAKWFNRAFTTDEDKTTENYKAFYADITKTSLAIATELYNSVDPSLFTVIADDPATDDNNAATREDNEALAAADNAVRLKKLKDFIRKNMFDVESDEYKEFLHVPDKDVYLTLVEACDALSKEYDAATQAKYEYYIARANIREYGLGLGLDNDYEGAKGTAAASNNSGIDKDTLQTLNNFTGKETITNPDGTKNTVQTLRYLGARNNANTAYVSTYITPSFTSATSGMVIEFSMTTQNYLPTAGIGFQPYSGSSWFGIAADGDLYAYDTSSERADAAFEIENCIVPGEWTRISLIYNPDDRAHCEFYIDYTFVGYFHGDLGNKGTIASALRMGNTGSASGEFSIDDVKCTRGLYFRDEKYISNMKDYEQVNYYCWYAQNEELAIPERLAAYNAAADLIPNFVEIDTDTGDVVVDPVTGEVAFKTLPDTMTNQEKDALKASINGFVTFDPQVIEIKFSKDNLNALVGMLEELSKIALNPNTTDINSRKKKLDAINKFVENCGEYIWDDGASSIPEAERGTVYDDSMNAITAATLRLAADTNINKFISIMDAFQSAHSVTMLNAKYADAQEIYGLLDVSLLNETGYEKFNTHYTVTYPGAPDKIFAQTGIANGNKFVSSVNYILKAYPNEADWRLYPIVQADLPRWPTDRAELAAFEEKLDELNALNERYGASIVVASAKWELSDVEKYNERYDYDIIPLAVAATAPDWPEKLDNDFKAVIGGMNAINVAYGGSIVIAPANWSASDIAEYNEMYEYDLLADGMTADKVASIRASFDYISDYMTMIRSVLNSGNCTETVTGFSTAYSRYESIGAHYYAILQADHVAHINEQLDKFVAADSYIEKYGLLAYIERYVAANEVDTESAAMKAVINRYNAYSGELDPQKLDYEKVLQQNTTYFINLVNLFDSALTYAEKKAYYDRATEYYYSMNVGSDDAQEAIKRYDAFTLELAVVENASKGLVEVMMLLPTAMTLDEYFGYLVDARIYLDDADASIEGVADAMVAFSEAYKAYNDKINATNANILDCADALGSLRANCGLSSIVTVIIAKLYSF